MEEGWRKSSSSVADDTGDCVEVTPCGEGYLLRDSKNQAGPVLPVPGPAWRPFITLARQHPPVDG